MPWHNHFFEKRFQLQSRIRALEKEVEDSKNVRYSLVMTSLHPSHHLPRTSCRISCFIDSSDCSHCLFLNFQATTISTTSDNEEADDLTILVSWLQYNLTCSSISLFYEWKDYQKFEKKTLKVFELLHFLKNVRFTVSHDFCMMHRIEKG